MQRLAKPFLESEAGMSLVETSTWGKQASKNIFQIIVLLIILDYLIKIHIKSVTLLLHAYTLGLCAKQATFAIWLFLCKM